MLIALELSGAAIQKELYPVYGSYVVSERTVQRWIAKFKNDRESLNDVSGRGRNPSVINKSTVKKCKIS